MISIFEIARFAGSKSANHGEKPNMKNIFKSSVKKSGEMVHHENVNQLNENGSSRMDTVLKMLLIAFISLLAFSSGVYFGKQLSDSDYQLKALESDFNSTHGTKTAEGGGEGGTNTNPEDAINQEEVAALSEKLVSGEKSELAKKDEHDADDKSHPSDEHASEQRKVASSAGHGDSHADKGHAKPAAKNGAKPEAAHGKADSHDAKADAPAPKADSHAEKAKAHDDHAHAKPDPHAAKPTEKAPKADSHSAKAASQKPDLSAAAKAAQRVANNASPSADHGKAGSESRVPTSLPKTVGTSQDVEFTVQIASYPTAGAAKEHAEDLVKKGFPAFPVEATVNGKVWYRVSVGSFKTMREATVYRGQLVQQTTVPSAIVQRIRR